MKRTILYETHQKHGAQIVEFAGFMMPVKYTSIIEEHKAVRNAAGLFDVSHMGEFWIKGDNALSFLQKITTNDVSKIEIGQAQYSCMPNGKGGIIDDIVIYKFKDKKYMVVVNASNIEKDWNWWVLNNTMNATIENTSDSISLIALQGPKSVEILQKITSINLSEIEYYHFKQGSIADIDNIIVAATGYTGEKGFELFCYNHDVVKLWNTIMEAGKDEGIIPIGLGARDTLRLEMGYCLYGNDIDETTSPIEAGLSWITKFVDGKDFINRDIFEKQKSQGVDKKLVGFTLIDKAIPRHSYEIFNKDGEKIGHVTSGTISPTMNIGIGLGYVATSYAKPNTEIYLNIRDKMNKAIVVKLPILKR